jgi:hypothetical protein
MPAHVNEMVPSVDIEPAFFDRYALPPGGAGNVGFPVGDVRERILDRPRVLRFGAGEQAIPLFIGQVGNEPVEQFKLLDRTFDHFLTVVAHGGEISYPCAVKGDGSAARAAGQPHADESGQVEPVPGCRESIFPLFYRYGDREQGRLWCIGRTTCMRNCDDGLTGHDRLKTIDLPRSAWVLEAGWLLL